MRVALLGQGPVPGRRAAGGRSGQFRQSLGELPGAAFAFLSFGFQIIEPRAERRGFRFETGNLRGAHLRGAGAFVEDCSRPRPTRSQIADFPGGFAEFDFRPGHLLADRLHEAFEGREAPGTPNPLGAESLFRGGELPYPGEEFVAPDGFFGHPEQPCPIRSFAHAARGSRVASCHPDVAVQLGKPLAHPLQRFPGRPQVRLALPPIQAVGAQPHRFLDQQPQIGGLAAEHLVGAPLFDQRIGPGAESGSGEKPPDVSPGAPAPIHLVNGLPAGVHAAADHHFPLKTTRGRLRRVGIRERIAACAVAGRPGGRGRFDEGAVSGERPRSVVGDTVSGLSRGRYPDAAHVEAHLGNPKRFAQSAPAEDELLPARPDGAGPQLTEHPEDRIGNVALSAAIRPHHRGSSLPELERHRFGEALEAGDLEPLDPHSGVT